MRSYLFRLETELTAVVPDQFLQYQLQACTAEDATPFQKQLHEKYSAACLAATGLVEEDQYEAALDKAADEFLMELLGNGLRMGVRGHVLAMLESSGIGGRCAPVKMLERISLKPETEDANPVQES